MNLQRKVELMIIFNLFEEAEIKNIIFLSIMDSCNLEFEMESKSGDIDLKREGDCKWKHDFGI